MSDKTNKTAFLDTTHGVMAPLSLLHCPSQHKEGHVATYQTAPTKRNETSKQPFINSPPKKNASTTIQLSRHSHPSHPSLKRRERARHDFTYTRKYTRTLIAVSCFLLQKLRGATLSPAHYYWRTTKTRSKSSFSWNSTLDYMMEQNIYLYPRKKQTKQKGKKTDNQVQKPKLPPFHPAPQFRTEQPCIHALGTESARWCNKLFIFKDSERCLSGPDTTPNDDATAERGS